ncbi:MAG: thioredoxin family protein [Deltaproteobacteria bacterium]|jgi:thioredoxin-related protein|nr:thioredoxin family protein [Deltaproteobacteria bacterium]
MKAFLSAGLFRLAAVALALTVLPVLSVPAAAQSGRPRFEGLKTLSFDEAAAEAAAGQKKILVYFWADWCGYCRKFNETVLLEEAVIEALNSSYALVSADLDDKSTGLVKQYRVRSVPTFIFFDTKAEPIFMLPGAIQAELFVWVLDFVSSNAYLDMDFEKYAEKRLNEVSEERRDNRRKRDENVKRDESVKRDQAAPSETDAAAPPEGAAAEPAAPKAVSPSPPEGAAAAPGVVSPAPTGGEAKPSAGLGV